MIWAPSARKGNEKMQPHSGVSRNARQTTTSELYLGVARALENGVTLRLCISRGDFERIGRRASESSGIGRCGHSIYVISLSFYFTVIRRTLCVFPARGPLAGSGMASVGERGPVVIVQGLRFPGQPGPTPFPAYDGPRRICDQPSQPIQHCECIIARHPPDGHVILARRRDWLG